MTSRMQNAQDYTPVETPPQQPPRQVTRAGYTGNPLHQDFMFNDAGAAQRSIRHPGAGQGSSTSVHGNGGGSFGGVPPADAGGVGRGAIDAAQMQGMQQGRSIPGDRRQDHQRGSVQPGPGGTYGRIQPNLHVPQPVLDNGAVANVPQSQLRRGGAAPENARRGNKWSGQPPSGYIESCRGCWVAISLLRSLIGKDIAEYILEHNLFEEFKGDVREQNYKTQIAGLNSIYNDARKRRRLDRQQQKQDMP